MLKNNMKYPKTIYVQVQNEGSNEYLQAEKSVEQIPDDGKVAVYELKEIKIRTTKVDIS
jgi:hypothetical protein